MDSIIHQWLNQRDNNVLRVTKLSGGHYTLILDVTAHIYKFLDTGFSIKIFQGQSVH